MTDRDLVRAVIAALVDTDATFAVRWGILSPVQRALVEARCLASLASARAEEPEDECDA